MRVAIVVPYVKRVHGNRHPFSIARALARRNEVVVYSETTLSTLLPEIRAKVTPARYEVMRMSQSDRFSNIDLLIRQLVRGFDRRLTGRIRHDHLQSPFDWVVVFSNEGHWIGDYISSWKEGLRPRTAVVLMDPIEQVLILARERSYKLARRLLSPAYPLVHAVESARLQKFDAVFSNSVWTAFLSSLLYGIGSVTSLAAVDSEVFSFSEIVDDELPYVAVPTVSLGPREARLVLSLAQRGVPIITFGPRSIKGLPHRGFLPDSELVSFLARARSTLFIFDYENLGLIPLESLAVGTPVVTLPKGGPYAELKGNPFVHFGEDDETLAAFCEGTLSSQRGSRQTDQIRASVSQYFATEVAGRLERSLQAFH